jgi:hypothetical protein
VAQAERTLVKSPPELWQLLVAPERMERWLALLAGEMHPAGITVVARNHERLLAWEPSSGNGARVEVALEEKGWGTHVRLSCEPHGSAELLEDALDELGTAHKRPFSRA